MNNQWSNLGYHNNNSNMMDSNQSDDVGSIVGSAAAAGGHHPGGYPGYPPYNPYNPYNPYSYDVYGSYMNRGGSGAGSSVGGGPAVANNPYGSYPQSQQGPPPMSNNPYSMAPTSISNPHQQQSLPSALHNQTIDINSSTNNQDFMLGNGQNRPGTPSDGESGSSLPLGAEANTMGPMMPVNFNGGNSNGGGWYQQQVPPPQLPPPHPTHHQYYSNNPPHMQQQQQFPPQLSNPYANPNQPQPQQQPQLHPQQSAALPQHSAGSFSLYSNNETRKSQYSGSIPYSSGNRSSSNGNPASSTTTGTTTHDIVDLTEEDDKYTNNDAANHSDEQQEDNNDNTELQENKRYKKMRHGPQNAAVMNLMEEEEVLVKSPVKKSSAAGKAMNRSGPNSRGAATSAAGNSGSSNSNHKRTPKNYRKSSTGRPSNIIDSPVSSSGGFSEPSSTAPSASTNSLHHNKLLQPAVAGIMEEEHQQRSSVAHHTTPKNVRKGSSAGGNNPASAGKASNNSSSSGHQHPHHVLTRSAEKKMKAAAALSTASPTSANAGGPKSGEKRKRNSPAAVIAAENTKSTKVPTTTSAITLPTNQSSVVDHSSRSSKMTNHHKNVVAKPSSPQMIASAAAPSGRNHNNNNRRKTTVAATNSSSVAATKTANTRSPNVKKTTPAVVAAPAAKREIGEMNEFNNSVLPTAPNGWFVPPNEFIKLAVDRLKEYKDTEGAYIGCQMPGGCHREVASCNNANGKERINWTMLVGDSEEVFVEHVFLEHFYHQTKLPFMTCIICGKNLPLKKLKQHHNKLHSDAPSPRFKHCFHQYISEFGEILDQAFPAPKPLIKPTQLLLALKDLIRKHGSQTPLKCWFPECTNPIVKMNEVEINRHVLGHYTQRGIYVCQVKGCKIEIPNDQLKHHFQKNHPKISKPAFEDFRYMHQKDLMGILFRCFTKPSLPASSSAPSHHQATAKVKSANKKKPLTGKSALASEPEPKRSKVMTNNGSHRHGFKNNINNDNENENENETDHDHRSPQLSPPIIISTKPPSHQLTAPESSSLSLSSSAAGSSNRHELNSNNPHPSSTVAAEDSNVGGVGGRKANKKTPSSVMEALDKVHNKYAQRVPDLKCGGIDCEKIFDKEMSKFQFEKHVFEHMDRSRYLCILCDTEVPAITPHLKKDHLKDKILQSHYVDNLVSLERDFLDTLEFCWPIKNDRKRTAQSSNNKPIYRSESEMEVEQPVPATRKTAPSISIESIQSVVNSQSFKSKNVKNIVAPLKTSQKEGSISSKVGDKKSTSPSEPEAVEEEIYSHPGRLQDIKGFKLVCSESDPKPVRFMDLLIKVQDECKGFHKASCLFPGCRSNIEVRTTSKLVDHVTNHHRKPGQYICVSCNAQLKTVQKLQSHSKQNCGNKHNKQDKVFRDKRGQHEDELITILSKVLPDEMKALLESSSSSSTPPAAAAAVLIKDGGGSSSSKRDTQDHQPISQDRKNGKSSKKTIPSTTTTIDGSDDDEDDEDDDEEDDGDDDGGDNNKNNVDPDSNNNDDEEDIDVDNQRNIASGVGNDTGPKSRRNAGKKGRRLTPTRRQPARGAGSGKMASVSPSKSTTPPVVGMDEDDEEEESSSTTTNSTSSSGGSNQTDEIDHQKEQEQRSSSHNIKSAPIPRNNKNQHVIGLESTDTNPVGVKSSKKNTSRPSSMIVACDDNTPKTIDGDTESNNHGPATKYQKKTTKKSGRKQKKAEIQSKTKENAVEPKETPASTSSTSDHHSKSTGIPTPEHYFRLLKAVVQQAKKRNGRIECQHPDCNRTLKNCTEGSIEDHISLRHLGNDRRQRSMLGGIQLYKCTGCGRPIDREHFTHLRHKCPRRYPQTSAAASSTSQGPLILDLRGIFEQDLIQVVEKCFPMIVKETVDDEFADIEEDELGMVEEKDGRHRHASSSSDVSTYYESRRNPSTSPGAEHQLSTIVEEDSIVISSLTTPASPLSKRRKVLNDPEAYQMLDDGDEESSKAIVDANNNPDALVIHSYTEAEKILTKLSTPKTRRVASRASSSASDHAVAPVGISGSLSPTPPKPKLMSLSELLNCGGGNNDDRYSDSSTTPSPAPETEEICETSEPPSNSNVDPNHSELMKVLEAANLHRLSGLSAEDFEPLLRIERLIVQSESTILSKTTANDGASTSGMIEAGKKERIERRVTALSVKHILESIVAQVNEKELADRQNWSAIKAYEKRLMSGVEFFVEHIKKEKWTDGQIYAAMNRLVDEVTSVQSNPSVHHADEIHGILEEIIESLPEDEWSTRISQSTCIYPVVSEIIQEMIGYVEERQSSEALNVSPLATVVVAGKDVDVYDGGCLVTSTTVLDDLLLGGDQSESEMSSNQIRNSENARHSVHHSEAESDILKKIQLLLSSLVQQVEKIKSAEPVIQLKTTEKYSFQNPSFETDLQRSPVSFIETTTNPNPQLRLSMDNALDVIDLVSHQIDVIGSMAGIISCLTLGNSCRNEPFKMRSAVRKLWSSEKQPSSKRLKLTTICPSETGPCAVVARLPSSNLTAKANSPEKVIEPSNYLIEQMIQTIESVQGMMVHREVSPNPSFVVVKLISLQSDVIICLDRLVSSAAASNQTSNISKPTENAFPTLIKPTVHHSVMSRQKSATFDHMKKDMKKMTLTTCVGNEKESSPIIIANQKLPSPSAKLVELIERQSGVVVCLDRLVSASVRPVSFRPATPVDVDSIYSVLESSVQMEKAMIQASQQPSTAKQIIQPDSEERIDEKIDDRSVASIQPDLLSPESTEMISSGMEDLTTMIEIAENLVVAAAINEQLTSDPSSLQSATLFDDNSRDRESDEKIENNGQTSATFSLNDVRIVADRLIESVCFHLDANMSAATPASPAATQLGNNIQVVPRLVMNEMLETVETIADCRKRWSSPLSPHTIALIKSFEYESDMDDLDNNTVPSSPSFKSMSCVENVDGSSSGRKEEVVRRRPSEKRELPLSPPSREIFDFLIDIVDAVDYVVEPTEPDDDVWSYCGENERSAEQQADDDNQTAFGPEGGSQEEPIQCCSTTTTGPKEIVVNKAQRKRVRFCCSQEKISSNDEPRRSPSPVTIDSARKCLIHLLESVSIVEQDSKSTAADAAGATETKSIVDHCRFVDNQAMVKNVSLSIVLNSLTLMNNNNNRSSSDRAEQQQAEQQHSIDDNVKTVISQILESVIKQIKPPLLPSPKKRVRLVDEEANNDRVPPPSSSEQLQSTLSSKTEDEMIIITDCLKSILANVITTKTMSALSPTQRQNEKVINRGSSSAMIQEDVRTVLNQILSSSTMSSITKPSCSRRPSSPPPKKRVRLNNHDDSFASSAEIKDDIVGDCLKFILQVIDESFSPSVNKAVRNQEIIMNDSARMTLMTPLISLDHQYAKTEVTIGSAVDWIQLTCDKAMRKCDENGVGDEQQEQMAISSSSQIENCLESILTEILVQDSGETFVYNKEETEGEIELMPKINEQDDSGELESLLTDILHQIVVIFDNNRDFPEEASDIEANLEDVNIDQQIGQVVVEDEYRSFMESMLDRLLEKDDETDSSVIGLLTELTEKVNNSLPSSFKSSAVHPRIELPELNSIPTDLFPIRRCTFLSSSSRSLSSRNSSTSPSYPSAPLYKYPWELSDDTSSDDDDDSDKSYCADDDSSSDRSSSSVPQENGADADGWSHDESTSSSSVVGREDGGAGVDDRFSLNSSSNTTNEALNVSFDESESESDAPPHQAVVKPERIHIFENPAVKTCDAAVSQLMNELLNRLLIRSRLADQKLLISSIENNNDYGPVSEMWDISDIDHMNDLVGETVRFLVDEVVLPEEDRMVEDTSAVLDEILSSVSSGGDVGMERMEIVEEKKEDSLVSKMIITNQHSPLSLSSSSPRLVLENDESGELMRRLVEGLVDCVVEEQHRENVRTEVMSRLAAWEVRFEKFQEDVADRRKRTERLADMSEALRLAYPSSSSSEWGQATSPSSAGSHSPTETYDQFKRRWDSITNYDYMYQTMNVPVSKSSTPDLGYHGDVEDYVDSEPDVHQERRHMVTTPIMDTSSDANEIIKNSLTKKLENRQKEALMSNFEKFDKLLEGRPRKMDVQLPAQSKMGATSGSEADVSDLVVPKRLPRFSSCPNINYIAASSSSSSSRPSSSRRPTAFRTLPSTHQMKMSLGSAEVRRREAVKRNLDELYELELYPEEREGLMNAYAAAGLAPSRFTIASSTNQYGNSSFDTMSACVISRNDKDAEENYDERKSNMSQQQQELETTLPIVNDNMELNLTPLVRPIAGQSGQMEEENEETSIDESDKMESAKATATDDMIDDKNSTCLMNPMLENENDENLDDTLPDVTAFTTTADSGRGSTDRNDDDGPIVRQTTIQGPPSISEEELMDHHQLSSSAEGWIIPTENLNDQVSSSTTAMAVEMTSDKDSSHKDVFVNSTDEEMILLGGNIGDIHGGIEGGPEAVNDRNGRHENDDGDEEEIDENFVLGLTDDNNDNEFPSLFGNS